MSAIPQSNTTRDALEIEQIRAHVTKLLTEADKLQAEQRKLTIEARWYPLIAGAALFGAGAAFAKLFFNA